MESIRRFFSPPAGHFFLLGPRGTGKSWWSRHAFPDALVIDLLEPALERRLLARPEMLEALVEGMPSQGLLSLMRSRRFRLFSTSCTASLSANTDGASSSPAHQRGSYGEAGSTFLVAALPTRSSFHIWLASWATASPWIMHCGMGSFRGFLAHRTPW